MPEYYYRALDGAGRVRNGKMNGSSKAFVRNRLRNLRLKPLSIKTASLERGAETETFLQRFYHYDANGKMQLTLLPETLTPKDLIVFTKQFSTMLSSGVPLVQALGVLVEQQRVRFFGRVLGRIRSAVENGATLSESMEPYPAIFSGLYVAMVRAGEASGNLDTILLKLVGYLERTAKVRGQIRAAMYYPAFVVIASVAVIGALLVYVVPQFAEQYKQSGQQLPDLTMLVLDLSDFLINYWLLILGLTGGVVLGVRAFMATKKGRFWIDQVALRAPVFGTLVQKVSIGRFCATLSAMLSSGVNLLEGLQICSTTSGNKHVEAVVLRIREAVEQGEKLSLPMSRSSIFPPMVTSMVSVGESTGALDTMLGKVSEFYEEEVDLAVQAILSLIEPTLIVVIGVFVGFVVLALYLPVFDMANVID
jgi:type IV pilus assembly protein PilC